MPSKNQDTLLTHAALVLWGKKILHARANRMMNMIVFHAFPSNKALQMHYTHELLGSFGKEK
jgi:hypothetical protein